MKPVEWTYCDFRRFLFAQIQFAQVTKQQGKLASLSKSPIPLQSFNRAIFKSQVNLQGVTGLHPTTDIETFSSPSPKLPRRRRYSRESCCKQGMACLDHARPHNWLLVPRRLVIEAASGITIYFSHLFDPELRSIISLCAKGKMGV